MVINQIQWSCTAGGSGRGLWSLEGLSEADRELVWDDAVEALGAEQIAMTAVERTRSIDAATGQFFRFADRAADNIYMPDKDDDVLSALARLQFPGSIFIQTPGEMSAREFDLERRNIPAQIRNRTETLPPGAVRNFLPRNTAVLAAGLHAGGSYVLVGQATEVFFSALRGQRAAIESCLLLPNIPSSFNERVVRQPVETRPAWMRTTLMTSARWIASVDRAWRPQFQSIHAA